MSINTLQIYMNYWNAMYPLGDTYFEINFNYSDSKYS